MVDIQANLAVAHGTLVVLLCLPLGKLTLSEQPVAGVVVSLLAKVASTTIVIVRCVLAVLVFSWIKGMLCLALPLLAVGIPSDAANVASTLVIRVATDTMSPSH
jgi:hypothetical protein